MSRELRPPEPVGEPYRGDPGSGVPFPKEGDFPGGHVALPQPPEREVPLVRAPNDPVTPEQRFARAALWLGVASIFIFSVVIGPIAFVMGLLAIRNGEVRTGKIAAACGLLGTFIGVLLLVLVQAGILPSVDEMIKELKRGR